LFRDILASDAQFLGYLHIIDIFLDMIERTIEPTDCNDGRQRTHCPT